MWSSPNCRVQVKQSRRLIKTPAAALLSNAIALVLWGDHLRGQFVNVARIGNLYDTAVPLAPCSLRKFQVGAWKPIATSCVASKSEAPRSRSKATLGAVTTLCRRIRRGKRYHQQNSEYCCLKRLNIKKLRGGSAAVMRVRKQGWICSK